VTGNKGSIPEREPEKRLPHPRKAAGAQITQSRYGEVVTINNNAEPLWFCNWNEYNLNLLTRTNWRASLVPAAAVIPAPIAYIKVVAVKTSVVEFWLGSVPGVLHWAFGLHALPSCKDAVSYGADCFLRITMSKSECSKQAL
jgi:hypothetical protein